MKPFYRSVRALLVFFFKAFYRHRIYGAEHLPEGPSLIAPNHASFFDPPLIAVSCKKEIEFLAKGDLFTSKWFGSLIRRLNAHPLSKTTSDLAVFKCILQLLKSQRTVVIFPEGSRTRNGELCPIKSGITMLSLKSNCPIVPAYIHGTFEIWPAGHRFPKLRGHTACVFGTPIQPEQYQHLDKRQAQDDLAAHLDSSIKALKAWYQNGCQGTPP